MYLIKIIMFLILSQFTSSCLADHDIHFSQQELEFIKNNPVVNIGSGASFAPFIFEDESGITMGYEKDIANLIEEKTGLKFNFEFGVWNEIQMRAEKGELHGLSTTSISEKRALIYNFSKPSLRFTAIAIVNRDNHQNIYKKEDVQNKKAAVQRGNVGFERLTKALGEVQIVYYDDIYSVLNAVVTNEVDFTVLDESVYYVANKLGISEFISTSFIINKEEAVHFALTKKQPLLTSIINKAIDDISPYQFSEIKARWFGENDKDKVQLTKKEQAYLHQKQHLTYCINPDYYPIESNKNGKHIGASADFIKAFQQHLFIPLQLVETKSWNESISAIKNDRCDFLPIAMKTAQRSAFLGFTKPYLSTPLVVATKFDVPFIAHLNELHTQKIGVLKDSAYSEILKLQHPDIKLLEVINTRAGLAKVEKGELFGFIGELSSISHQFQKGYSTKLKITGRFDQKFDFSIATQKENKTLLAIFNKLIATLEPDSQVNTLHKYVSISHESFVDHSVIYKIMCIFAIVLGLLLLWNKRVQKAKNMLDERYKLLDLKKNKIQESEDRLNIVLAHGHVGSWQVNLADNSSKRSLIHDQIFGYDSLQSEWTYEIFIEHVIPEDRGYVEKVIQEAKSNNEDWSFECRIKRPDGEIRWIFGSGGQDFDEQGQSQLMTGIVQDISERKKIEVEKSLHHAELQSLFDALPDIYFRMKSDGTILDCHAQHENRLYISPESFIGKRMQDVLPSEVGELFDVKVAELAQTNSIIVFGYKLLVNKKLLRFEASLNKIAGNNQIICVSRDVTEQFKATEVLATSEQRFRMIFEQAAIGVALIASHSGKFIRVNQRLCSMLGYSMQEMLNGKTYKDITHPDDLQISLNSLDKIVDEQHPEVSLEKRYVHKDGHIVFVELTISPGQNNSKNSHPFIVVVQDISERKKSEESLKLAANVFTHAAEGIVITDADATIIDVNGTFIETTGYSREEVIGRNPRILASGRQSRKFYADMWQELLANGHWSGEVWNRRKNNSLYAEILTISSVKDAKGEISNYVGLFSDITLMKEHQRQLEHNANYDLLTNLPNRSLLSDRLSQAMLHCRRHKQSLAVVFLDLDGFKAVNDNHGHDVGDDLLIALSARMKIALREGDTLARIGGDEFVVVLADLDKVEDCEPILERLLVATSDPIVIRDTVINISASIGVTLYPKDDVDADLLMRHADQAMYVAKESGKNCYHLFNTAQGDAVKAQREWLDAIRCALDNEQFVLFYQPKVNMRTGLVTGVEALIRWQHPKRGLLSPIEFLPFIENHPMSIEMGEWVIETALAQISQWQAKDKNLPLNISVNIAASQLQQPDFTQKLSRVLASHPDVAPRYLELEVLETSALDDVLRVSKIMNACLELGVKFALDDFGTGYSSLTYLRRLPANLIKIDQSFVRDMLNDADDLAIVEGVIGLAKSFKRDVIAEGVETIEHGTTLLGLGCELAQGYGIAKPMPAHEIATWVTNWKPDNNWKA